MTYNDKDKHTETGEHTGSPLDRMVQWFKTMTTNDYIRGINDHGWDRFNGKLWQRNYYEHIIRDDQELYAIREYIRYNPLKWAEDEENPHMKCRGEVVSPVSGKQKQGGETPPLRKKSWHTMGI